MADPGRRCLDVGRKILPLLGISLLLGASQVLALPMPYASDGLSLALSSLMPVISLSGLLGLGASATGDEGCLHRVASIAGSVSVVIYLVLAWTVALGWSWAGDAAPGVSVAFAVSVAGTIAVAIGMFICCYMTVESDGCGCAGHFACFRSAGFALTSVSLLGFAGRVLPNWTAMRVAASSAGSDGCLFVESIALGSLGSGQGTYPLAAGAPVAAPSLGALCAAWVVLLAVAARAPGLRCVESARDSLPSGSCAHCSRELAEPLFGTGKCRFCSWCWRSFCLSSRAHSTGSRRRRP